MMATNSRRTVSSRTLRTMWLASAALAGAAHSANAAIISYVGTASGNWATASQWTPTGPPAAGSDVQIIVPSGSSASPTITYNYTSNPILNSLTLDSAGTGAPTLLQNQGTLSDLNTVIGDTGSATYTQTAGTHNVGTTAESSLALGNNSPGKGTYNISGSAILNVHDEIFVGYGGTGTFNQSGGTVNVTGSTSIIYIAHTSRGTNGQGTYSLTGGAVNVHQLDVGEFGTGSFTQSAGTATVDKLYVAYDTTSVGTYTLSGTGSLIVNEMAVIANFGTGTFIQNGGTSSIASTLYLGYASTPSVVGSYQLGSGQLSTQTSVVGQTSIGTFTQTGGTHTISTNLIIAGTTSAAGSSYSLQGGTLTAPGGIQVNSGGTMKYSGGTLNAAAGITVNAGGTLAFSGAGTRTLTASVSNSGTLKTTSTIASFSATVTNSSAYISSGSDNYFATLSVASGGYLSAGSGDRFFVADDLSSSSTQSTLWSTANAELHFVNDPANSGHTHAFSVNGADLGTTAAGYVKNYAWGNLTLDSGQSLTLSDPHTGAAGLYLNTLALAGGTAQLTSIQSNGIKIYYNSAAAADAYLAGRTYSLPGGGSLIPMSVPEPSTVSILALAAVTLLSRRRQDCRKTTQR